MTFLVASDSFATPAPAVLYRRTVDDPALVRHLVAAVDALRVAPLGTQLCTDSSVALRLDFLAPTASATLDENSPCARATLIVNGAPGPTLASGLNGIVMQMFGVQESTTADGLPTITPAPAPASP